VLVAQQRTGEDPGVPASAATHLVRLLGSWGPGPRHLPGLALTGVSVPCRAGPTFVDALVFTPWGVVVMVARDAGAGPGFAAADSEWAAAGVAATKAALGALGGGRYVTGLVVVVPPEPVRAANGGVELPAAAVELLPGALLPAPAAGPAGADGARTTLVAPPAREAPVATPLLPVRRSEAGVATVLADPRGLRRIVAQHNRWRTVWPADDVLEACYALSLAHLAPARAALLGDGFPLRLPSENRAPRLAVPPEAPEPPREPVVEAPVPQPRGPVSAGFPRPRRVRHVPWGLVVVLTVLVTIGLTVAVFVAQVFHGT
jgi:hypothetical protein